MLSNPLSLPIELAAFGECCRYAMSASNELERYTELRLWKARALSLFVRAGFSNGVALLIQSEAFAVLGTTGDLDVARAIFDLMEPLICEYPEGLPFASPALCWRVLHERRAAILFLQQRYAEAQRGYEEARVFAASMEDDRGLLKVDASLANCKYMLATDDIARQEAVAGTRRVVTECQRLGIGGNILSLATNNLDRMNRGDRHLVVYDVIWPAP
jgi:hypothetical protein